MEEKDRPLISWKAISIILIILILAYAGYKGFAYGQTALENYIDAEADAAAATSHLFTPDIFAMISVSRYRATPAWTLSILTMFQILSLQQGVSDSE